MPDARIGQRTHMIDDPYVLARFSREPSPIQSARHGHDCMLTDTTLKFTRIAIRSRSTTLVHSEVEQAALPMYVDDSRPEIDTSHRIVIAAPLIGLYIQFGRPSF